MELTGSTLVGPPGTGRTELRRMAARILGGSQIPPEEAAALLLPMVRRAVRTARGPAALVSWLHGCLGAPPAGDRAERGATLADTLAHLLCAPPGSPDTRADSH